MDGDHGITPKFSNCDIINKNKTILLCIKHKIILLYINESNVNFKKSRSHKHI